MLSVTEFEDLLSSYQPLCFAHIPKTAGSTFVEHFRAHAAQETTFWYSPEQRRLFHSAKDLGNGPATRVCGGHFAIHDFLPRCGENAMFLSFVRHPVTRLVSYYLFASRSSARHETANAARELQLYDFLQYLETHRPRILFNQQCRFLSASNDLAQDMAIRFDDVQSAWKGLTLFLALSSACNDVTRRVAGVALNRPVDSVQKRKVTRERPRDLPDERSRQYILETNTEDLKLFNAQGIYDGRAE